LLSQAVASNTKTVQTGIAIGDAPKKYSVIGIMMRKTNRNIPNWYRKRRTRLACSARSEVCLSMAFTYF
jgi:hypothetical protein